MHDVVDRTGHVWAELVWDGDALQTLRVPGATVGRATFDHPVLGPVAEIRGTGGELLTVISAVDWARPTQIPAIDAPGKLPPGAGGVILDVLARLAVRAGVRELRYAGPYPTSALYHALLRSFRTTATEAAFTADALARAARGARDELPFAFTPAPHERVAIPHGHVELRDGLERAVLDGTAYARDDAAIARLVPAHAPAGHHAEVWFGDAPYARIATLAADGALVDGPHAPPPSTSPVLGRAFPPPLRAALADLVADAVPAPLSADARAFVTTHPLVWADLGVRPARVTADGLAVHAALWDRLAPQGLARLALALAEALAPVVAARIAGAAGDGSSSPPPAPHPSPQDQA